MSRTLISSGSTFEKTAGYSRAVVQGQWCFVSGTTGYDYRSMQIPTGLEDQIANCFKTIGAVLDEAGFSLDDVVRVTYIVSDRSLVPRALACVGSYFRDIRPAATMMGSVAEKGRVGDWRGNGRRIGGSCCRRLSHCRCLTPRHGSVSSRRSPNRTGGFTASGSPVGSCVSHTEHPGNRGQQVIGLAGAAQLPPCGARCVRWVVEPVDASTTPHLERPRFLHLGM